MSIQAVLTLTKVLHVCNTFPIILQLYFNIIDTRITSIFVIIICVLAVVFMAFCMSLIALRNQVKNRCCSMHTHPEENVMKKSSDSLKEKVEDTELTPNVAYCYVTKRPAMAAM